MKAIILICTAASGCAYNGSSIHSDLSAETISEQVRSRWTLGMLAPEAEKTARGARLRPYSTVLPAISAGQKARLGMCTQIEPPGLRVFDVFPPFHEIGLLYFWFDDAKLERVAYQPPRPSFDRPPPELLILMPPPGMTP